MKKENVNNQCVVIEIKLDSQVRLDISQLPEDVTKALIKRSTHRDPVFVARRRRGLSTDGLDLYINSYTIEKNNLSLWRGLLGDVVRLFKKHKLQYAIKDKRLWLPKIDLTCSIVPRDYQIPAIEKMIKRQQTIIRGAAGGGKTECLLAAAVYFRQPTLVIVWQERQQRVWLERVAKYFQFEPGGVGGVFKTPKLAPITVGMVQSIRTRLDGLHDKFGCVLCDEIQRASAPSVREVINSFPAAVRLGASDDERRRDEREFLTYDTFGSLSYNFGKSTGQCPVDILLVPTEHKDSDGEEFWPSIVEYLIDDESRNALIINLACRLANEGKRILIWSDRLEHCKNLLNALTSRGVKAGLLIGGKKRKAEADSTEAGLLDGSISVGIGTSVAEQSINIPPLTDGIVTCASAGQKIYRFKQIRGRIARPFPGKEKATLWYIWDQKVRRLKTKINGIKKRYELKKLILPYDQKEKDQMTVRAPITLITLRAGCKMLGLKAPVGATQTALRKMIEAALIKDTSYGTIGCGACFSDITANLASCPFCAAKFKPIPESTQFDEEQEEQAPEEQEGEEETQEEGEEVEGQEEESEEGEYEEEESEEGSEEEEGEAEEEEESEAGEEEEEEESPEEEEEEQAEEEEGEYEEEESEEGEPAEEEEEEGEEGEEGAEEEEYSYLEEEPSEEEESSEEEEGEEEEPEEDDEPKKPAKRKKRKTAGRPPKRKTPEVKEKQRTLEAKRDEIKQELPYKLDDLKQMKRTALVMIAGVLGIHNAVELGSTDAIIREIVKVQFKKYPSKKLVQTAAKPVTKPSVKPVGKPVSKPVTKPSGKPVMKKKK